MTGRGTARHAAGRCGVPGTSIPTGEGGQRHVYTQHPVTAAALPTDAGKPHGTSPAAAPVISRNPEGNYMDAGVAGGPRSHQHLRTWRLGVIHQRRQGEPRGNDSQGRLRDDDEPARPVQGRPPETPHPLRAGTGRAAADHLLKPAQVSGGRVGALGCTATKSGPLPQTMDTAATRMQTRTRLFAAAGSAGAPARLPATGTSAHARLERACAP